MPNFDAENMTYKRRMKLKCILVLFLFLGGCVEEMIITREIEVEKLWKQQSQLEMLTKIKINSLAADDKLFLYGPDFFSWITDENEVKHAATWGYPEFYRLPISSDYFVQVYDFGDEAQIRLTLSEAPELSQAEALIDLKQLASDFRGIDFGYFYQSSGIDINANGQCLVPIKSNNPNGDLIAYLFNVSVQRGLKINVTDTVRITIPNPSPLTKPTISCSKGIKDYFIYSAYGGTYKIYSDGRHKKLMDTDVLNIFYHADRLVALKEPSQIFISEDDGETWESFDNYPNYFVMARYFSLGDSLVATRNSEIFSVKFNGTNFTIRPLENEGLETNEITAISEFGDSIYASTYSGVFFRGKAMFFDPLKEN